MKLTAKVKPDEASLARLDAILARFERPQQSDMIPLLQAIQQQYGYLDPAILQEASRRTRLPLNRLCGVATFYAQFSYEPRGKHLVRVCRGTACHVRGARGVCGAVERLLGITEGQTTPDFKFSLETVACLGTCFLSPVIMIDNRFYGQLTAEKVESIIKRFA